MAKRKGDANVDVITFVCGNEHKIAEAKLMLKDVKVKIEYKALELPEIQGESEFICESKCRDAAKLVEGPVIVEDTSLCYNAIYGLPGPYVKWFYEKLGAEGLYKLLSGFEDKTATAVCIFAYTQGKDKPVLCFRGETKGTIVPPTGSSGFGWDPIFLPEGKRKTFAELSTDEKNKISHRSKALMKLRDHFTSQKQKKSRKK